jgi:hypothetical protein
MAPPTARPTISSPRPAPLFSLGILKPPTTKQKLHKPQKQKTKKKYKKVPIRAFPQ